MPVDRPPVPHPASSLPSGPDDARTDAARPDDALAAGASVADAGPADLTTALAAAACLGAWSHDPVSDRLSVAARLGEALGLRPGEWPGAPLARVLSGLDPEDRPRIQAIFEAVRATGGPFEAEFRAPGARVLRLTGRAGAAGRTPCTCGLAFDLTELRRTRPGPALEARLQAQWQVNQLAGHVIAMRGLVAALDSPALTRLIDRMARETGFELARRLGPPRDELRH